MSTIKKKCQINIHASARLYRELLEETRILAGNCFEQDFVNKEAFEALVFLVVSYRKQILTAENLEETLKILDIEEDLLLETIQTLFIIHERTIPEDMIDVVRNLSEFLPLKTQCEESLPVEGTITPKEAYVTVFESMEIGQTEKDPIKFQIRFLEQLLLENPLNLHIQYLLGKKYMESNRLVQAKKIFLRLYQINAKDIDVVCDLGLIEMIMGMCIVTGKQIGRASCRERVYVLV